MDLDGFFETCQEDRPTIEMCNLIIDTFINLDKRGAVDTNHLEKKINRERNDEDIRYCVDQMERHELLSFRDYSSFGISQESMRMHKSKSLIKRFDEYLDEKEQERMHLERERWLSKSSKFLNIVYIATAIYVFGDALFRIFSKHGGAIETIKAWLNGPQ